MICSPCCLRYILLLSDSKVSVPAGTKGVQLEQTVSLRHMAAERPVNESLIEHEFRPTLPWRTVSSGQRQ